MKDGCSSDFDTGSTGRHKLGCLVEADRHSQLTRQDVAHSGIKKICWVQLQGRVGLLVTAASRGKSTWLQQLVSKSMMPTTQSQCMGILVQRVCTKRAESERCRPQLAFITTCQRKLTGSNSKFGEPFTSQAHKTHTGSGTPARCTHAAV
jgi:hypothetical protein